MNWDDLRMFLALARCGTLKAAATELGVSHSTVSRRLDALSEATGATLFDKTPEGFVLTAAGEQVQALAEEMESRALSLERMLVGSDARLSGQLRVTTVDVLVPQLAGVVGEFVQRYPDVDITLQTENRLADLSRREADVSIRLHSNPSDHLVGRRVARVDWAPYASTELVERMGIDTPLSEWPWLVAYDERGVTMIEKWVASATGDRKPVARVDSGQTALALAGRGQGAIIASPFFAEPAGLVRIGPAFPDMANYIWILTHPDLRQTARVRAFMDVFAECTADLPDLAACSDNG